MHSHSYAEIFPLMNAADLASLAEDIKQNGLRAPVTLYEEKILDGRNRAAACTLAGIEPATREFSGDDPLAFVLSSNLHRRHLSDDQRALVAAKIAQLGRGRPSSKNRRESPIIPSITEAASRMSVTPWAIRMAKTVLQSPEQTAAVEAGQKGINKAATEIRQAREANAEKTAEDAEVRDATGQLIPEVLLPLWHRRPEVQERLDIISRVRCCIKYNSEEEDDVLYHPVDMNRVLDRLDEACAEFSLAMPYAVCPTCDGRAVVGQTCPLCRGRGLLSKHTFDTCVPEDLKKTRAAMSVP